MTENVTATRPRWQTTPMVSPDYEGEPRIYWRRPLLEGGTDVNPDLDRLHRMLERHTKESETSIIMGGSHGGDTIANKLISEILARDYVQSEMEQLSAWQRTDTELHPRLGVYIDAPKPSHTFAPDISSPNPHVFILHSRADAYETIKLLRTIHERVAGVPVVGTSISPNEASALDEQTRRLAEMEELLRKFSELAEDWDSYGGSSISSDIIDEARMILTAGINLNLPPAWAAPGGDGGIGIQWDNDQAELYIDIVPEEETTYFLTAKAGDGIEADGVLTNANLSGVLNKFAESSA